MQCPNDGAVLTMSERSGIEIDYCPTCRGVWLDRGELDKIIERSFAQAPAASAAPPPQAPQAGQQQGYQQSYRPDYQPRSSQYSSSHRPHKRKENWLSELFD